MLTCVIKIQVGLDPEELGSSWEGCKDGKGRLYQCRRALLSYGLHSQAKSLRDGATTLVVWLLKVLKNQGHMLSQVEMPELPWQTGREMGVQKQIYCIRTENLLAQYVPWEGTKVTGKRDAEIVETDDCPLQAKADGRKCCYGTGFSESNGNKSIPM